MNILITGGAGFVGSFLTDQLVAQGHRVRVYDNLEPQVHRGKLPAYLNPDAEFVRGDVGDRNSLHRALKSVEVVFHFAASVGVGQSMYEIAKYTATNDLGAATMLDLVVNEHRDHVRKMIIAGSMSEYGEGAYRCSSCGVVKAAERLPSALDAGDWEPKCGKCGSALAPSPTPEDWSLACTSVYAINKRTQEDLFLTVGRAFEIPVVSLRFFNIYGPRQSLSNPYTGVMAIFMSRLKAGHSPIVYEDGLQTRDFISVHDIVDANISAMISARADHRIFNVGTGRPIPIAEVARTLAGVMTSKLSPSLTGKYRKGDIRHCYADITRIATDLGWKPRVSLQHGLAELVEWGHTAESQDLSDAAISELKAKGVI